MFPLLIVNILENHATKERPLSITEITEFVNREFGPFAMEKEQLMNRSTVTRILDASFLTKVDARFSRCECPEADKQQLGC